MRVPLRRDVMFCALSGMAFSLFLACGVRGEVVISEIWPGGLPGEEASSDWIELTNLGSEAVTGLDQWHVRDTPVPASVPDGLWLAGGQLQGVSVLEPGESAVFLLSWEDVILENTSPTLEEAIAAFHALWGTDASSIKLGFAMDADGEGGPGLSRSGDTVIVYDGSYTGANVVDTQSFPVSDFASYIYNPMTGEFGELAEAGRFGAYESLLPGNTESDQPAVASPGVVPEPSGLALCGVLAGLACVRGRRAD